MPSTVLEDILRCIFLFTRIKFCIISKYSSSAFISIPKRLTHAIKEFSSEVLTIPLREMLSCCDARSPTDAVDDIRQIGAELLDLLYEAMVFLRQLIPSESFFSHLVEGKLIVDNDEPIVEEWEEDDEDMDGNTKNIVENVSVMNTIEIHTLCFPLDTSNTNEPFEQNSSVQRASDVSGGEDKSVKEISKKNTEIEDNMRLLDDYIRMQKTLAFEGEMELSGYFWCTSRCTRHAAEW